ncbi:MAG: heavy metal-binding domain-containing protein [Clostridia bacterium]|nr:heavy metal-binding domain-containing protein [Candidatus Pelethousia sp.]NCB31302.1 heavy metal-binding domain-containing protein [Clostridia bacterium]
MLFVTTETIPGKKLELLGLVEGGTIQSKNIGWDISQGLKTIVGGELKAYNQMMETARALATERMEAQAKALGADAVVCMRYASTSVMQGAAEILVYGTAVRFLPD